MHASSNSDEDVEFHMAFSGGGYRAAAFCLGVLACMIDQNLMSRIRSITSVSGGSFLNVFIAQHFAVEDQSTSDARNLVNDFAHRLATQSVYFAGPLVTLFTVTLISFAVTMVVSFLIILVSFAARPELRLIAGMVFTSSSVACVWLFSIRNTILISAIRRVLSLESQWRKTKFPNNLNLGRQHVVCATDLVRGEPVFFSSGGVRSLSFGQSSRTLDPARVIAFSAAFPGLMRPFRVKASDLFPSPSRAPDGDLVLVDGGVVNNLGTQWWEPAAGGTAGTFAARVVTIVVDASVALSSWSPTKYLPSKTLAAATRVFSLIYFNSVRPRFDKHRWQGTSSGNVAIGVSLAEDPFRALSSNMAFDRDGKTSELYGQLVGQQSEITDIAIRAQSVPTGLHALGHTAVRDLVAHGYNLALIELAGAALAKRQSNGPTLGDWFQLNSEDSN